MSETLSPYGFLTLAEFAAYMGRTVGADSNDDDRMTRALNSATAWMNKRSARNLKARNYRTAVSVTTTLSALSGATTLAVPTASLKVGDDLVGTNIALGTQVQSVDSPTQITLTRATSGAVAQGATISTVTRPIYIDQPSDLEIGGRRIEWPGPVLGSQELWFPEYPVLSGNIFAVYWLDPMNNRTAVDMTVVRLEESSGRVLISYDVFPRGDLKIQLEFRGGYEQPTATGYGHWNEWQDLQRIQRRAAEVLYQDELSHRGRSIDTSLGGFSARVPSMQMPDDIEDALRPYWRMSG